MAVHFVRGLQSDDPEYVKVGHKSKIYFEAVQVFLHVTTLQAAHPDHPEVSMLPH